MLLHSLIVAAVLTSADPVIVDFGNRGKVAVPLPSPQGANPPYQLEKTVMSPRGDAAALKFCLNVAVLGSHVCPVILVRPNGQISGQPLTLRHGVVGQLLWTNNGRYLVGAGGNTLRLWNLAGGVRLAVPPSGLSKLNERRSSVAIGRLWWQKNDLCVSTVEGWFNAQTHARTVQMTTVRYQVPTMKPVESVNLPYQPGKEAPCHVPQSEPAGQP